MSGPRAPPAARGGGGDLRVPPKARFRAVAPVHPSEDPARVEAAVGGVFVGAASRRRFSVVSDSADASCLERVREAIRTGAESRSAYRRNLENNMDDDSVWFYLNKQAAFAGRVAICREADESPLGPIKITATSANPRDVVDWILG